MKKFMFKNLKNDFLSIRFAKGETREEALANAMNDINTEEISLERAAELNALIAEADQERKEGKAKFYKTGKQIIKAAKNINKK